MRRTHPQLQIRFREAGQVDRASDGARWEGGDPERRRGACLVDAAAQAVRPGAGVQQSTKQPTKYKDSAAQTGACGVDGLTTCEAALAMIKQKEEEEEVAFNVFRCTRLCLYPRAPMAEN